MGTIIYYYKITSSDYNNLVTWLTDEDELVQNFSFQFPDIPAANGYYYALVDDIDPDEYDYLEAMGIFPETAHFGISTTPSYVGP